MSDIPKCCHECTHLDFYAMTIWDEGPEDPGCDIGVMFPTKKQTCKKQEKYGGDD